MAKVNDEVFKKPGAQKKQRTKLNKVVVGGEVKTKKPTIKDKMADVFLSPDRGNVGQYLIFDVLIPAAKNMLCNLGHAALDRSFWGESRQTYSNPRQNVNGSTYSYNSCYCQNQYQANQSQQYVHVNRGGVFNFDTIIFGMRAEAQEVLDCLIMRIVDSDYATVSDLYDLIGRTSDFTMEKWGWYNLDNAYVTNIRGGFVIKLPKPQTIR